MVATRQQAAEGLNLSDVVLNQIREVPGLKDAQVSAFADQGIVTLTGCVKTEAERLAVEQAAGKVRGVKAIADDLQVSCDLERASTDIAKEALRNLRGHVFLASEDIRVIVRGGRVILEGVVHQELQKLLAASQVKRVRGISGVSNLLEVKPEAAIEAPAAEAEGRGADNASFANAGWVDIGEAEAG